MYFYLIDQRQPYYGLIVQGICQKALPLGFFWFNTFTNNLKFYFSKVISFLKKILTDPHGASGKETACQGGRR